MQGNLKVIASLNGIYALLLPTEVQAHQQEHQYEAEGYERVSDWFDVIEDKGHRKLIHPLMNRINSLNGECSGKWAFQPDEARPIEQLDAAVGSMLSRLTAVHGAYVDACEIAEDAQDYVTTTLIHVHLEWLEKQISKFERRASQIEELGVDGFLQEMFDK